MLLDQARFSQGLARFTVVAGLSSLGAAILAYVAYRILGCIGVGVLALLIAFVAVQAEMDDAAPIGGQQNTSLYSSVLQAQQQTSRAEKAARHAAGRTTLRALTIAKCIGAVLALAGILGFFFLQLPS